MNLQRVRQLATIPRMLRMKSGLALGGGITIVALLVTLIFHHAFDGLERGARDAQYRFRGESKIDSSILVVYFDDDAIHALGGWPLKRSYYALAISVLHELGAKVIGVDVAFSEPSNEYPEYDEVLSTVLQKAGNVVLSGYFKNLGDSDSGTAEKSLARFTYPQPARLHFLAGKHFVSPFPTLLDAAKSLGHANLTNEFEVPLFVKAGTQLIPSFAFELLRLSVNAEKTSVTFSAGSSTLNTLQQVFTVPLNEEGVFRINHDGGIRALNTLQALQLLQAYDAAKGGRATQFPLEIVRGKIIIVGVIAQGRSTFVPTPYAQQFPAVGIHAMMLSNILQKNYLQIPPLGIEYTIAILFGILAAFCVDARREIYGLLVILGVTLFYILGSFFLFSLLAWVLPLVRPLFILLTTTIVLVFIKHQLVRRSLAKLEREKETIALQLREKEHRLKMLEEELFASKHQHAHERSTAIVEEIRRYKEEIQRLTAQVSDLQVYEAVSEEGDRSPLSFEGIIFRPGSSMAGIVEFIKKIAANNAAVLILGESGTGKELVARAIHRQSQRKDKPFIAVNCGALSETLLESELFGHEKGAFTGALKEKPGRFELADGGTIFLDEIGETSEAFQVKLLRVLQEGELERVGATMTMKVNVRVIASTNKDLKKAVAEKDFREDLYYRLNIFTIALPPLRERAEDISLLVEHFMNMEQPGMRMSSIVMEAFCQYPWKGNVRELQGVIKRAVILARSDHRDIIRIKDLPEELLPVVKSTADIEEQILESMREKNFSRSAISETADELGGLNRGTVAEYFRGYCFKIFYEQQYNVEAAIQYIAHSTDPEVQGKVRKKITEYLSNVVELVKREEPFEQVQLLSRPKFKNLPQRYHRYLEEILRSYHRDLWHLDGK